MCFPYLQLGTPHICGVPSCTYAFSILIRAVNAVLSTYEMSCRSYHTTSSGRVIDVGAQCLLPKTISEDVFLIFLVALHDMEASDMSLEGSSHRFNIRLEGIPHMAENVDIVQDKTSP